MAVSALYDFGIYDDSRYNVLVISGSSSFSFSSQTVLTKREYISATRAFSFGSTSHLAGTGKLLVNDTLVFTSDAVIEAKKSRIKASTAFAFIPSVSIRGVRNARANISMNFNTEVDVFGKGKLKDTVSFVFSSDAAINRVRIYATHTQLNFSSRRAKIKFTNFGSDFNTWGDGGNPYSTNTSSSTFDLLYRETSGIPEKPFIEG